MKNFYNIVSVVPALIAFSYVFYLYRQGVLVEPNWLYGGIALCVVIIASLVFNRFRHLVLGNLLVFICYGWCLSMGVTIALTGQFLWPVLVVVTPGALLLSAILLAGSVAKMRLDKIAGIRNRANIIGLEGAQVTYQTMLLSPFLLIAIIVMIQFLDTWAFLVLLCFPLAVRNIKLMKRVTEQSLILVETLEGRTARFTLLFGLLMIAGNVMATF